jgi:hypothetical protein
LSPLPTLEQHLLLLGDLLELLVDGRWLARKYLLKAFDVDLLRLEFGTGQQRFLARLASFFFGLLGLTEGRASVAAFMPRLRRIGGITTIVVSSGRIGLDRHVLWCARGELLAAIGRGRRRLRFFLDRSLLFGISHGVP